uniref:T-box domain-containing protein n=1 Tax=Anisakis simplex TaxID=6269 RepID=A0A0M3JME9_ANISI
LSNDNDRDSDDDSDNNTTHNADSNDNTVNSDDITRHRRIYAQPYSEQSACASTSNGTDCDGNNISHISDEACSNASDETNDIDEQHSSTADFLMAKCEQRISSESTSAATSTSILNSRSEPANSSADSVKSSSSASTNSSAASSSSSSMAGSVVDPLPKSCPAPGNSPALKRVECKLEGRELWSKFYELSTEMIITKSGR